MDSSEYSDFQESSSEEDQLKQETFEFERGEYKVKDDTVTLIKLEKGDDSFTVPAYVQNNDVTYTVVGIGPRALRDAKLKKLNFADDSKISTLGKDSLYSHSLEEVTLPANLEQLKQGWCNFTLKLNTISLPSGNQNFQIHEGSLYNMNFDILYFVPRRTRQFTLPNSIKVIYGYCFEQCRKLKSLEFQEEPVLMRIGPWAFSHCGLSSVQFPDSLKTISYDAFFHTHTLKEISFGDNSQLKEIQISAFKDTRLTELTLPKSCKKVAIAAFQNCKNLKSVILKSEDSLQVWKDAFSGCSPELKYEIMSGVNLVKHEGLDTIEKGGEINNA